MQQKEKKMQDFIDNFDAIKHKKKEASQLVQENIIQLLKQIDQVMLIVFAKHITFDL